MARREERDGQAQQLRTDRGGRVPRPPRSDTYNLFTYTPSTRRFSNAIQRLFAIRLAYLYKFTYIEMYQKAPLS